MPRVRISNSKINSYGTRVLTAGMDIEQYNRNPVLLYMHERGEVIGYMKDVKVEGDEVTGEPVFDEASDLSKRCKAQFDFGSLRMVSAGLDIVSMSDNDDDMEDGQTAPTITKSKLYEVSLVDIGANDDAIRLRQEGKIITLGHGGDNPLPRINKNKQMEQKQLALTLGLAENATEEQITAKLGELKLSAGKVDKLEKEKSDLKLAAITQAVETAVTEKRISAEKKDHYINLGKMVGIDCLNKTLADMTPQAKLSAIVGSQGGPSKSTHNGEYSKLSEVPAEELSAMRDENPAMYKKLYKAEYGMECSLD